MAWFFLFIDWLIDWFVAAIAELLDNAVDEVWFNLNVIYALLCNWSSNLGLLKVHGWLCVSCF